MPELVARVDQRVVGVAALAEHLGDALLLQAVGHEHRSSHRRGSPTRLMVISRSSVISCIAYFGPSRPRPLSFTPLNGNQIDAAAGRLVDVHDADVNPARRGQRRGDVAREDAGGKAELRGVDLRRSHRRACRTESPTPPARRSPRTGRACRVARRRGSSASAARRARCPPLTMRAPCATASLDPCLGARGFALADHRADGGLRVARVADLQRSRWPRRTCPETARATRRCTNSRCVEVHAWPARRKAEFAIRGAARSRSASSQTIVAAMLPSSSAIGRSPTSRCSCLPTAVLPVKV